MSYTRIVENLVLNETLRIVGSEWDNVLIRNVVIENVDGDGIILRDVENVTIEQVTIRNVTGDGIKLSTLGSTSNVTIMDSHLSRIGEDGINAGERNGVDHPGLQIIGNTIDQTGLNSANTGLVHGIYVQSTDFLIQDNLVTASTDGNGISVRSSGEVLNNVVDGSYQSGIAYFADHAAGASDHLEIANNIIMDAGVGTDRSPIDLLSIPNGSNVVSNIVVSGNVTAPTDRPAIDVANGYDRINTSVTLTGNSVIDETQLRTHLAESNDGVTNIVNDFVTSSDPRPGAGMFPDLENDDNMRLTLSDDGTGRTDVMLSQGDMNIEAYTVDPGTTMGRAVIDDMRVRISAYADGRRADLSIDSGRLSVQSPSDEPGSDISGSDTLVFEMGRGPVGEISQVLIGLSDADQGETVLIEVLDDGSLVNTFERPADAVVDIELASSFDQVRVSAGEGDSFSLSWIEFGAPEEYFF